MLHKFPLEIVEHMFYYKTQRSPLIEKWPLVEQARGGETMRRHILHVDQNCFRVTRSHWIDCSPIRENPLYRQRSLSLTK